MDDCLRLFDVWALARTFNEGSMDESQVCNCSLQASSGLQELFIWARAIVLDPGQHWMILYDFVSTDS